MEKEVKKKNGKRSGSVNDLVRKSGEKKLVNKEAF